MSRLSGSPVKPLPTTPPSLVGRPEVQITDLSSSSSSGPLTMSSKRFSGQPVPRPAPIPIPEPVPAPTGAVSSTTSSSGEGPSSSDTTGSALASVSAELIQHITIGGPEGAAGHVHSNSLSPSTSPRETNNLLGESTTVTPRSTSIPRISSMPHSQQRPRSAVDSPYATSPAGNNQQISRPHSSADQWGVRDGGEQSQSRSHSPSADSMLRPTVGSGAMPRSRSSNFINTPSPLNPNALPLPRRPGSSSSRPASMVLYRLAGIGDDFNPQMSSLSPPVTTNSRRASRFSTMSSANSTYSVFSDSKYPAPAREDGSLTPPPSGAFLPYEYDPSWDQDAPDDEEDALHTPDPPGTKEGIGAFNFRGFFNIVVVFGILLALISVFALYPVISYYANAKVNFFSGTGQANPTNDGDSIPVGSTSRTSSDLIDPDTPDSAKTWAGLDGNNYKLVFSDEFKKDGRTFKKGDDPFWTAVDLHDAKNNDLNWYDSAQVTTKDGSLVITMQQESSNGFDYISGMLQSWNKFCFTGGYVEISVSLPGTNQNTGFTPQAYTMGNLARSGYGATEEGLVPYSYDSCDVGTIGGQGDGSNTLLGQRLSACTCSAEQAAGNHPGPVGTAHPLQGRGAPQVDILGYLNEQGTPSFVSQSLRVAPFSQGRFVNTGATALDGTVNDYTGSTTQQVISGLTSVPGTSYTDGGAQFTTFGYEHITNGGRAAAGSLHWTKGGSETFRVSATALEADGVVAQRLIPSEPMYIVLSLALSQAVLPIDTTALTFPAKYLVNYVRVYQIDGQDEKITCDPTDFPTASYISSHQGAYEDATKQTWELAGYTAPTNSQNGGCQLGG